jgi:hypothetical protein
LQKNRMAARTKHALRDDLRRRASGSLGWRFGQ